MKSVIISIIMFLFLILIHEFGHFIIAKKVELGLMNLLLEWALKFFQNKKEKLFIL